MPGPSPKRIALCDRIRARTESASSLLSLRDQYCHFFKGQLNVHFHLTGRDWRSLIALSYLFLWYVVATNLTRVFIIFSKVLCEADPYHHDHCRNH